MRSRLAKLAAEAKKIKVAPATARVRAGKNAKPDTQYRILESPGCRRVVLAGPEGRVDARTAESLLWKVCQSVMRRGDARQVPAACARLPNTLPHSNTAQLQSWETNYLIQVQYKEGGRR